MSPLPPPQATALRPLPLDGVTVLALEQAVAAPLCTRHLADLGARVIKVERPDGGDFARNYDETIRGMSSHFVWLNRGKESLMLDLKQHSSIEVIHRILLNTDVFVQNLIPGAVDRLGLPLSSLREENPRLICATISGYGMDGPLRDAKAYDLLIQSEAGLVSITGTEDAPAKSGVPSADIAAGMYSLSAILAALYERERTGKGSTIEVSLFDSLIEWMSYPLYYTAHAGHSPARMGTDHATIVPYGTVRTGDGKELVVAVQNEREWQNFCRHVLRRPDLHNQERFVSQSARVLNRAQLESIIADIAATLTVEELEMRLEDGGIAHARRRDLPDVVEHPQLVSRDRWVEVQTPVGRIPSLLPPFIYPDRRPAMQPVPSLGEHTDAILDEFDV